MQIVDTVFTQFGIRGVHQTEQPQDSDGYCEMIGAADKIVDITVAIDKLDKIGLDNVNAELKAGGLSDEAVAPFAAHHQPERNEQGEAGRDEGRPGRE